MTDTEVTEVSMVPKNAAPVGASVLVEQQKAIQEVQAALIIAKRFPRDETAAYNKIMKACERPVLAEQAIYSLPISGQSKTGPSIRLAEVLAQSWGNVKFGIRELERAERKSKCIAFCWDQETNTKAELEFDVDHWIEVGKKGEKSRKWITDPVEIDRLIANRGARKLRNCILNCIPGDIVDAALRKCRDTQKKGGGEPLIDRVRKMVGAFDRHGVSQEMLEARLGHAVDLTTADELVDLMAIWKSIEDKQAKRGDFFDFPEDEKDVAAEAQTVSEMIKRKQPKENENA